MTGLFFCLASAKNAGLLFFPATIQPNTGVYSAFCCVNAIYTVNAAKQRTGLYRGVSCNLTNPTTYDTRPTQAAIIPSVPRWIVSQRRSTSSAYQIPDTTPDAVQASTTAYYNKVYISVANRKPCQPGGLRSGTGQQPGRAGSLWHPPPGGAV